MSEAVARRFGAADAVRPLPRNRNAYAVADVRRSNPASWIGWLERAREYRHDRVGKLAAAPLIVARAGGVISAR